MRNTGKDALYRGIRIAVLYIALAAWARGATTKVDLSRFDSSGDVQVAEHDGRLTASWPIDATQRGVLELSLDSDKPLISRLATGPNAAGARTILSDVQPCGVLTVGTRDLKTAGWTIFFDNPRRRPSQVFPLRIGRASARVVTEQGRTSIALDGTSAGPFGGEFRFTFYPGGRLVRAAAVMSTKRDASAILFDAGLVARPDQKASWQSVAWTNLSDTIVRSPAAEVADVEGQPLRVRDRTIIAEGTNGGSVAMVPPPHQYFYPLDFVDNLAQAWRGRHYRELIDGHGFGVRQPIEGDNRWVPWMNAPPDTRQDLGVFYLLSDGDAAQATSDALTYTRGDRFAALDRHRTFSSHYHVEHAIDFLKQQKAQNTVGVPAGLENPQFARRLKAMGVNIVHLAEFHLSDADMKIADRLTRLKTLHAECERLSDRNFLLLPGEEPNVHLGGHWLSFFPKPVYWLLGRKDGEPFVETTDQYGKVYRVGSAADVLKLMEAEGGLMWAAHPRIKGSTGFPERYKETDFFKSPHYLGAAWKAMPADLSSPKLGTRVLDLLDDMNNWGTRKQAPGEVDVFQIDANSELYAHMNINYLRLAEVPTFADGWQPVLDALRGGQFFTTTGEIVIPSFSIDGKQSGESISRPTGPSKVRARLAWTFPLSFAELVSGDGKTVFRERVELGDTRAFGERTLDWTADLQNRTWARFEVWDVAGNGAYSQPVWTD